MKKKGNPYKIKYIRGKVEYDVRMWKVPYKQEVGVIVDASMEATFKFYKEGAELIEGKVPDTIKADIEKAIVGYFYNYRIHE